VYKCILNNVFQYHLIPTIDFIAEPTRFPINKKDSTALMNFDTKTRQRLNNIQIYH